MADNNNSSPGKRLKREEKKFIKPTTQDSLDLYNNSLAVENFYKKSKGPYSFEDDTPSSWGKMLLKNPFSELDKANREYIDKIKAYPAQDIIKNNTKQTIRGANKLSSIYRNNIDKNKFTQRDFSHGTLNIDAPMALYDRRIKPTMLSSYSNLSPYVNDDVEIFKYDPIAVKPVSMLTPKERIEREKKYGKISSSTPKIQSQPVIKRKATEIIEPLTPRQATFTPQEMVAPVMRPEMRPADDFTAPKVGMGFALRYPSQDFLSRLKSRLTGEPLMPYWVDKEGIKRYPSRGENSPEAIRNIQMLKSGLNPNNPEDALELKRIDELLKGKRK